MAVMLIAKYRFSCVPFDVSAKAIQFVLIISAGWLKFMTKLCMMKYKSIGILVLSFGIAGQAVAMRCGHDLVDVGDHIEEVLDHCGEPQSVDTRTKIVGSTFRHPRRTLDIQQFEEIQVEEWVYNFGNSRLKQYLRFENGVLKEIKSLGRGY